MSRLKSTDSAISSWSYHPIDLFRKISSISQASLQGARGNILLLQKLHSLILSLFPEGECTLVTLARKEATIRTWTNYTIKKPCIPGTKDASLIVANSNKTQASKLSINLSMIESPLFESSLEVCGIESTSVQKTISCLICTADECRRDDKYMQGMSSFLCNRHFASSLSIRHILVEPRSLIRREPIVCNIKAHSIFMRAFARA